MSLGVNLAEYKVVIDGITTLEEKLDLVNVNGTGEKELFDVAVKVHYARIFAKTRFIPGAYATIG